MPSSCYTNGERGSAGEAMDADRKEMKAFSWTAPRTRAALLLAEDSLSDEGIANTVGVSAVTLWRWKQHPEFTARIAEHVEALDRAVSRYRIAKRRERVRILDQQQSRLLELQDARAVKYADDVPGGETGLMIPQVKIGGGGPDGPVVVTEWVRDDVSPEIRALQKQAAMELGQWSEKSSVDHSGSIRREIVVVLEGDTGSVDVTSSATFADFEAEVEALFAAEPHPEDGR